MKFQIFNESLIHCISQVKDHTFYTLLLIADEKCIFEQVCVSERGFLRYWPNFPLQ